MQSSCYDGAVLVNMPVLVSGAALLVGIGALVLELQVSRRHERRLRADGAVEPSDDVYRLLAVGYPAALLVMCVEGALGPGAAPRMLAAGIFLFALSKALKSWAIATLGPRWSVRVLVPPGAVPIADGPYRVMRHPIYLALLGELLACSLAVGAPKTGALAILVVGALIARRVVIEERSMADAATELMVDQPPA